MRLYRANWISDAFVLAELTSMLLAFVVGPLVAFRWHWRRGGQGITVATFAGIIGGGVYGVIYALIQSHEPMLNALPVAVAAVISALTFAWMGTVSGLYLSLVAWSVSTLTGRVQRLGKRLSSKRGG